MRSYRDAVRLLLVFVASDKRCKLSGIELEDLTFDRVQRFLRHLEEGRGNRVPTRNQRLAALHTFFEYVCSRSPEIFAVCQQIAAIPTKRTPAPATQFLERDEVAALFARLPSSGRHALRDRALLLFLYNTGARVQEAADLRVEHLDLERGPRARLHGKGDKWRTCPLWDETARLLGQLAGESPTPQAPVFRSAAGKPLTRFGIYKLVRRHTAPPTDTNPFCESTKSMTRAPCQIAVDRSTESRRGESQHATVGNSKVHGGGGGGGGGAWCGNFYVSTLLPSLRG